MTARLAVLGLVLALGSPAAAGTAPVAALVHVEANVGGASGGHTALRLGDAVYHYQQGGDDRLLLAREPWEPFRFRYNVLQNRPLRIASLDLTQGEARRVRDHFAGLWLAEQEELDRLDAGARDLAHAEALAGDRAGAPVRGAGLFALEARPLPAAAADAADATGSLEQARERLELRTARAVWRDATPLADAAVIVAPDARPLSQRERAVLADFADALERDIAELLASSRPDRGFALLVTIARQRAVERSLAESRLVIADPYPDSSRGSSRGALAGRVLVLDARHVRARREEYEAVAAATLESLRRGRDLLLSRPLHERDYNRLEGLVARAREYERGARGHPVRETDAPLRPQRSAELVVRAVRAGDGDAGALRDAARARLDRDRRRFAERHPYDLVRNNCVTALARSLEAAGVPLAGGRLAFVPFVFFRQVVQDRGAPVEDVPAWRVRRVEELAAAGNDLRVHAREGNTLSSRVYRRRHEDGSFLFFSDGSPWPRPLYGALNVGYGALDAALGVLTAPFDRGARLARGAKGMFFSLPELAFVNIRKGSFDAAGLRDAAAE